MKKSPSKNGTNYYIKPKYGDQEKICYMDTNCLLVHLRQYIYDFTYTSHYKVNRSLPIRKSKKVVGVMKNELVGKIIKEIVQKIMLRMMTILTGKQMAQKSVQ